MTLRIGTRGSALALWQARTVGSLLETAGHAVEIVVIRTAGDERPGGNRDVPPAEARGPVPLKGLFVKEIEDALLREDIDLAVHSAKDMSVVLPDGLTIAAVLPREDPRDAIVLPAAAAVTTVDSALARLGEAAIGTSSVRRSAQLAALLPRATFPPVRGNVDTRIRKLDSGQFDGLVLAAAGMLRLGLGGRISAALPIDRCVPAPGQGIVAIEIRAADTRTRGALDALNDSRAAISLTAERAVVHHLGGGCQLPLGVIALHADGNLEMHAVVASADGQRIIRRRAHGRPETAAALGAGLAGDLAAAGAMALLDEARRP